MARVAGDAAAQNRGLIQNAGAAEEKHVTIFTRLLQEYPNPTRS